MSLLGVGVLSKVKELISLFGNEEREERNESRDVRIPSPHLPLPPSSKRDLDSIYFK